MMLRIRRYGCAACWTWLLACAIGCSAPATPAHSYVDGPADVAIPAGEEPVMDQDEP